MPGFRPACLIFLALSATPVAARDTKSDEPKPPPLFQQVLDCKAVSDASARLACYDEKVTALGAATEKRDIVITDKAELRQTKRGLFGFALPISRLFGGGKDEDKADEVKRLETSVVSARHSRDGDWLVTLQEGGTWEQTDSKGFALSPKTGQKAVVTKGSFGSYFVSVDGQPGVKMRRVQ